MKIQFAPLLSCTLLLNLASSSLPAQQTKRIQSAGNPIIADGSYYSADPAPLVANGTLYIFSGRDEAPRGVNDFIINEWQLLATTNVQSGRWLFYPGILKPEKLFAWAAPGHAYAGQIVQGPDQRFYLYAPVQEADSHNQDPFAIGVAVADNPLGPWKDAHPSGPIVSQSVPEPNSIQNIDPTVMVDDDHRVYLYWGTFGQLRGVELRSDMVTPVGNVVHVKTLRGYFEAPYLFKRRNVYYMVYADNEAGPISPCTPTVYHACIAYGTANSPLGPWTYRGVILDPVSSTTSHPGVAEFKGKWYLVYHTADAKGGGHFRRSVAIDEMHWDDSVTPARIRKVQPTRAPGPKPSPTRNIAPAAHAVVSNQPVPIQYWIGALNDGIVRENPLPPDMWATWTPHNLPQQWIQYEWSTPVTLNASRIWFWSDHPTGSSEGVAPPAHWRLEYWRNGSWHPVAHPGEYPTSVGTPVTIQFATVTTRCLRAVFQASGQQTKYAAVAVQEWEALTPAPILLSSLPKPSPNSTACSER